MTISKRTIVPAAVTTAVVAGIGLTAAAVTAQEASAQLTAGTVVPAMGASSTSASYQQGLQDAMIKATQAKLDADNAAAEAAAQAAEQERITTYVAALQRAQAAEAAAVTVAPAAPAAQSQAPASTPAPASTGGSSTSTSNSASSSSAGGSGDASSWANSAAAMAVKTCESGNNYSTNTGNGYYGAWQFDLPSWLANGGGAYAATPDQASAAAQDQVAYNYYQSAGWGPWECAK